MASGKKKKPQETLLRRVLKRLARGAGIIAALLVAYMLFEGGVVRLRFATVPLRSLPSSFEGTRILYLSDLHINTLNSVEKVNALMDELMRLNPDMLLLGGDYTSFEPLMRITGGGSRMGAYAVETEMRDLFFLNLSEFSPPLGKYGIAGDSDNLLERNSGSSLEEAMKLGGVTLLKDKAVRLSKGGDSIVILGVDDWSTGMQDTHTPASLVSSKDFVILLCHNPEAILALNNQPASDGMWIDLTLTGHTHGGGISLLGYELFNPLKNEERFSSGWHKENSAKVLISNGVGNDFLPLRLGAEPQAHLITLTRIVQ